MSKTEVLKTDSERFSYMVGMDIGGSLRNVPQEITIEALVRGIQDAIEGKKPLLTPEEIREIQQKAMAAMQEQRARDGEASMAEGNAFLEENKDKEGVVVTESGLQYLVIEKGDGAKPTTKDTVRVHYAGTLLDGTEFDSSYKRNEPVEFGVTQVIPGWTEALQLMQVGAKYRLFIPSELAYAGNPPPQSSIPPNSVLLFEVELLDIVDGK